MTFPSSVQFYVKDTSNNPIQNVLCSGFENGQTYYTDANGQMKDFFEGPRMALYVLQKSGYKTVHFFYWIGELQTIVKHVTMNAGTGIDRYGQGRVQGNIKKNGVNHANQSVCWYSANFDYGHWGTTDANGNFQINQCTLSSGNDQLWVYEGGTRVKTYSCNNYYPCYADLQIKTKNISYGNLTISGYVRRPGAYYNPPVSGATVVLREDANVMDTVTTNAQGFYSSTFSLWNTDTIGVFASHAYGDDQIEVYNASPGNTYTNRDLMLNDN